MKKYIFEKGVLMPLCCIEDDIYFNYLTGEVITNENTLNFLKNGLKKRILQIKEIDLKIYTIEEYILPTYDRALVAYNYRINGVDNYLNVNKIPLDKEQNRFVIKKIMNKEYIQEVIWE